MKKIMSLGHYYVDPKHIASFTDQVVADFMSSSATVDPEYRHQTDPSEKLYEITVEITAEAA